MVPSIRSGPDSIRPAWRDPLRLCLGPAVGAEFGSLRGVHLAQHPHILASCLDLPSPFLPAQSPLSFLSFHLAITTSPSAPSELCLWTARLRSLPHSRSDRCSPSAGGRNLPSRRAPLKQARDLTPLTTSSDPDIVQGHALGRSPNDRVIRRARAESTWARDGQCGKRTGNSRGGRFQATPSTKPSQYAKVK